MIMWCKGQTDKPLKLSKVGHNDENKKKSHIVAIISKKIKSSSICGVGCSDEVNQKKDEMRQEL